MSVQGKVAIVKKNNAGFYALCVDDSWYGCGKNIPSSSSSGEAIVRGDVISFEVKKNGDYLNVIDNSIDKVKSEVVETVPSAVAKTSVIADTPRSSNDFWANKEVRDVETQKVIQFQAARNSAISVLTALLAAEELPALGGKKADHVDTFLDMLMDMTLRMYEEAKVQGSVGNSTPKMSEVEVD